MWYLFKNGHKTAKYGSFFDGFYKINSNKNPLKCELIGVAFLKKLMYNKTRTKGVFLYGKKYRKNNNWN